MANSSEPAFKTSRLFNYCTVFFVVLWPWHVYYSLRYTYLWLAGLTSGPSYDVRDHVLFYFLLALGTYIIYLWLYYNVIKVVHDNFDKVIQDNTTPNSPPKP